MFRTKMFRTENDSNLLNSLVLSEIFTVLDDPVVRPAVVPDDLDFDGSPDRLERRQDFAERRNPDVTRRIGLASVPSSVLSEHLDGLEVAGHVERVEERRIFFEQV